MEEEPIRCPPRKADIAIAVQPDYQKWYSITHGMTRDEVTALLGKPLPRCWMDAHHADYGYISYPAAPHKLTMAFILGFDAHGRVNSKVDPFAGSFSPDGKPTKPKLTTPQDGARFLHYPRILDLRWFPCSGQYPMLYDLEVGFTSPPHAPPTPYREELDYREFGQPYAVIEFPGSQPGRFRVRGRNALGTGPWSDHHTFTFEDPRHPYRERAASAEPR